MRRLLVTLCAVLTLALTGPAIVTAQEATPTVDLATTAERTDIRYVLPFDPDGLNPELSTAATVEGVCGFSSIVALGRPDAWDCITADNEIFDPCFEPFMMDPEALGQLACLDSPFADEVTLLTLTEPLARQKEAGDPGADPAQAMSPGDDATIEPWDLPWAIDLANGDQCTLLHGTLTVLAGQTVHYSCVEGGMVLGEMDRSQPLWMVSYMGEGERASHLVAVRTAWS